MSKFYLSITLFLMFFFFSVRCEYKTTMACDKNDKGRTGYLLQVDKCFNLFLKEGTIFYGDGKKASIGNFVTKGGYCAKVVKAEEETESKMQFSASIIGPEKVENLTEISITISIRNYLNTKFWSIKEISVSNQSEEVKFTKDNLVAPFKFSYHCGNLGLHKSKIQNDKGDFANLLTMIKLNDFQVQPFDALENDIFAQSFDCETWFTLGTFSGLIVLILFTFILAFGICYIINIKTNDRFEDPKGKMLTIGNVDG